MHHRMTAGKHAHTFGIEAEPVFTYIAGNCREAIADHAIEAVTELVAEAIEAVIANYFAANPLERIKAARRPHDADDFATRNAAQESLDDRGS